MGFRPPAQEGKKRSSTNFHQRAAFQKRLLRGGLQLVLVKSGFSDSAGKICFVLFFFFSFQFYVYSYSPIKLSQFKVVIKSQPQYLTTCQDSVPKMALFCGSLFLLGTVPPGDLTPSLQCSSFLLLSSERKRASLPLPLNGSKGSQGIFGPANRGLCVPENQSLKLLF